MLPEMDADKVRGLEARVRRAMTNYPKVIALADACEALLARVEELEALTLSQAERIYKQSELLSRRAEVSG